MLIWAAPRGSIELILLLLLCFAGAILFTFLLLIFLLAERVPNDLSSVEIICEFVLCSWASFCIFRDFFHNFNGIG